MFNMDGLSDISTLIILKIVYILFILKLQFNGNMFFVHPKYNVINSTI